MTEKKTIKTVLKEQIKSGQRSKAALTLSGLVNSHICYYFPSPLKWRKQKSIIL